MATTDPAPVRFGRGPIGGALRAGRPMVAIVAVLLTTGGHTMNLRELGVSRGWVSAEVYSLQSCYLFSLAAVMLACPALNRLWSCRRLARWGLVLAIVGAVVNVLDAGDPLSTALIGRAAAGAGSGLVIYAVPVLLPPGWETPLAWAVILCPVVGPGFVSAATMTYESSDWQHGFLFEGVIAGIGLLALLSMARTSKPEDPPPPARGSLAYYPGLIVASASLIYILHWGQLYGWLEDPRIAVAIAVFAVASAVSLALAWPQLDWGILGENWIRLALCFLGGVCQFFHAYIMNVYGGAMMTLSSWQRAFLIWPLPIGIAASLVVASFILPEPVRRRGLAVRGLPLAVVGLSLMSAGLYLCYQSMMEWPYWMIRDVVDLNWFPAPGPWELAPGRFLAGMGIGLFMVAMDAHYSPDPGREEVVRPLMSVLQFFGGGIAAAVLVNFVIIGHKVHYSYSAERDAIQAEEMVQRQEYMADRLLRAGHDAPERAATALVYRFIHYEADNLVFATIYIAFSALAFGAAVFFFLLWAGRRLRRV